MPYTICLPLDAPKNFSAAINFGAYKIDVSAAKPHICETDDELLRCARRAPTLFVRELQMTLGEMLAKAEAEIAQEEEPAQPAPPAPPVESETVVPFEVPPVVEAPAPLLEDEPESAAPEAQEGEAPATFSCEICGAGPFKTRTGLMSHTRANHKE